MGAGEVDPDEVAVVPDPLLADLAGVQRFTGQVISWIKAGLSMNCLQVPEHLLVTRAALVLVTQTAGG